MKFSSLVELENTLIHVCGQSLRVVLVVQGVHMEATLNSSSRFLLQGLVSGHDLHFKAHGTRVKTCPTCKKMLPVRIEEVRDEDFTEPERGE